MKLIPNLQRKLELLKKRLFELNKKWKLGIFSSLLLGWMLAALGNIQAQDTFPRVFDIAELPWKKASDGTGEIICQMKIPQRIEKVFINTSV
ncbi:MAG: hypothetical protein AAF363_12550 [Bacteroidota bacterium]